MHNEKNNLSSKNYSNSYIYSCPNQCHRFYVIPWIKLKIIIKNKKYISHLQLKWTVPLGKIWMATLAEVKMEFSTTDPFLTNVVSGSHSSRWWWIPFKNTPWANVIKLFCPWFMDFCTRLESICKTRLEKFTKDKHSSLLRKSVIYGQKSFLTLGPGFIVLKSTFFVTDSWGK
jgi:hypothetical protein